MFHAQLETDIANLRQKITVNDERIKVLQRIAERQKLLSGRGTGSKAAYDEALLRVAEMNARSTELNGTLNLLLLRDRSAETGVFIDNSGGTPNWLRYGELELRLEKRRASHEKHAAEAVLSEAYKDIENEQQTLNALAQTQVTAPPGSFIHSVRAAPGATVSAGDKIMEWIDCLELLIDVPVSDAELPLILRGMRAEVILEGEKLTRKATVYRSRGSSATLDSSDLAAISKGRTAGVAQVLLKLDRLPDNSSDCPVGRAAYVEFPEVGLIDVVRVRLRL
jgi:multidrug efflux pump subunit AcrA (membrane-fusion protein)